MKDQYVLRERDDQEIARLHFQHQVWNNETQGALEKGRIRKGDHIMDLGSGPGYLSFQLARLVGPEGKVYAIDNSEKFISFVQKKGAPNVEALKLDIRKDLGRLKLSGRLDQVFCRWVLMFIENTEEIIDEIYQLLKEGGKFISMEYFRFRQIDIFPDSPIFNHIYENVYRLLLERGGDPDVGGKVQAMMRQSGFRKVQVYPVYRTGPAGSDLWKWLEQTNQNHTNLVEGKLITKEELQAYYENWAKRAEDPVSFITAPPLMITIGEK